MPGSRFKRGNPAYTCCPTLCGNTCWHALNGCTGGIATGTTIEVYKDGTCGNVTVTVLDCDTGLPISGMFVNIYEASNIVTPIGGGTTNASGVVVVTGIPSGTTIKIRTFKSGQGDWITGNIGPVVCSATVTIYHQTDSILGPCATPPTVNLNPTGREVVASGTVNGSGDYCVDLSAYVGQTLKWDAGFLPGCFRQGSGIILGDPCGRTINLVFMPDEIGTCWPYHCGSRFCCSACTCPLPGRMKLFDTVLKPFGSMGPPGTYHDCGDCDQYISVSGETILQRSRNYPVWWDCDPTWYTGGIGSRQCVPTYTLTCEGSQVFLGTGMCLQCSWQNRDAYGNVTTIWGCGKGPPIGVGLVYAKCEGAKVAATSLTCNPFSATFDIPAIVADCFVWNGWSGTYAECVGTITQPARTITVVGEY